MTSARRGAKSENQNEVAGNGSSEGKAKQDMEWHRKKIRTQKKRQMEHVKGGNGLYS